MKTIIYVGNKLSNSGKTVTSIETLGNLLGGLGNYQLILTSSKKNKLLRIIDMISTVRRYRSEADYILIDTYSTLNFYYALIIAKLASYYQLKYIPILRGGNLPERLIKSPKYSKMIFSNAYQNIAPSNYLKSTFVTAGFSNTICIPNNINLIDYPFLKRDKIQPRLLWVRSFRAIYNPSMAVEVLKLLKEKYSNAKLCMIGPTNDESFDQVKKLTASYHLEKDVEFTGLLSKTEWHEKSKEFDVFINTTDFDNTPVSVIEAMALGLPVVSTNVGGIPYLLEDQKDAILTKKGDFHEMANKISKLIENENLSNSLTEEARRKVALFDWEIIKNQWTSVLK